MSGWSSLPEPTVASPAAHGSPVRITLGDMDTDRDWGFADAADASAYLREVGVLWATWLIALVPLLISRGWLVLVFGAVVIAALIWAARPLQARAARLVPEDSVVGGRRSFLIGRSTERDVVLRQLAYGEAPLRRAVELTGSGRWWLTGRVVVVGMTVVAFVWVLMTLVSAPASA